MKFQIYAKADNTMEFYWVLSSGFSSFKINIRKLKIFQPTDHRESSFINPK